MQTMTLPESFTIESVEALHSDLLQALQSGEALTVRGEAVHHIDMAGLQLLLATQRDFAQRGSSFTLESCSPTLQQAIETAGLQVPIFSNKEA